MATIITRAGKGSPLTNNEVDANFTNLNAELGLQTATNVIVEVRNSTGATLTKGTVVYITGAIGQLPTVSKAIATSDATSAQTLGLISADLPNNTNGFVTIIGLITDIDTSAYADGAQLYLSGTTAGTYTATKTLAPTHLVYVGVVEHSHITQGKIFVKVQNGYELDEIHDVVISSPQTGQSIVYDSSTQLWYNKAPKVGSDTQYTTTVTAAGTTTLTSASTYLQYFTGTTTQTIVLPVTSTLALGWSFHICNNSTGNLTVNSSGGNLIVTVLPSTTVHITCVDTAVTTAAGWDFGYTDFNTVTGTGSAVLATAPILNGRLTFVNDVASGQNLYFERLGSNQWTFNSTAGVGEIYRISGNSITIAQDTTITRGGLSVAPSLAVPSALNVSQTWNYPTIATTATSGTGTIATITFASSAGQLAVGTTVIVSGVTPTGYNGTFVITSAGATSVSYANTTTGAQTVAGTVQFIPAAIKLNVTDTSSNATSNLMDLQVGGASKFKIDKTGIITVTDVAKAITFGTSGATLQRNSGQNIGFGLNGTNGSTIGANGVSVASAGSFSFSSTTDAQSNIDLYLYRDAADTLAQRRGVNAQSKRIYNTYTDASNYELGKIAWSSNILQIGTEKAGTGIARDLVLQTDGTTRITIDATGNISFTATSASFNSQITVVNGRGLINSGLLNSANLSLYSNNTRSLELFTDATAGRGIIIATGTGIVQFGGITSSFPALKREATALRVRLADESGDAQLVAHRLTSAGGIIENSTSFYTDNFGVRTSQTGYIGFSSLALTSGNVDVALYRDAAGILAQRNGVNAQTFRIYNSYTDASNYSRLAINNNQIASEVLGTGSLAVTADTPLLNLAQTWNNAAVTFTAAKINVTNTASNSASLLMDLQIGGSSKFRIANSGTISFGNSTNFPQSFIPIGNTGFDIKCYSTIVGGFGAVDYPRGLQLGSASSLMWNTGTGVTTAANVDLYLTRDAANTLAQRNSVNAQTFRLYNTYTDASNYERVSFGWTGSIAYITTAGAGTGIDRALNLRGRELYLSGSTAGDQWYFQTTGNLLPIANNTYDIGNALYRLRSLYLGTSLNITGGVGAAGDIVTATGSVTVRAPSQGGSLVFAVNEAGTNRFQVAQAFTSAQGAYALGANSASPDVFINREAADVLSQYRSTNPQTFRVYNTYTDASNYSRLYFTANNGGGAAFIGTQAAGTGSPNDLWLLGPSITFANTAGAQRWSINSSGHFVGQTDNTYDIGASGATRPRNVYIAGDSSASSFSTINPTVTVDTPAANLSQTWNFPTIATTGASGTAGTATITFAAQAIAPTVGGWVTIAGVTPTGYNGTYIITASSTTSVSYTNATTGVQTVAGTIQIAPTAIKLNVTDTASGANSLLMDLQTGGTTRFGVLKDGAVYSQGSTINKHFSIYSNGGGFACSNFGALLSASSYNAIYTGYGPRFANDVTIQWSSAATITTGGGSADLVISRKTTASLQFGGVDSATPVPQTIGPQSVVAGTTDTAGADFTIRGSQGTGTGTGGSILFQLASAGTTGTAQNPLVTKLTLSPSLLNSAVSIVSPDYLGCLRVNFTGRTALESLSNIIEQRNGVNAQTFRIYNTYTDGSNYERGFVRWNTNVFEIGAESAGTGTLRDVSIIAPAAKAITFTVGSGTPVAIINNDRLMVNNPSAFFGFTDIRIYRAAANILNFGGTSTTTGSALQLQEMSAPVAPAANSVRIYAEDNGAGKTRLMALFATGAAQQIAIEP